jgi:hypothetical protein
VNVPDMATPAQAREWIRFMCGYSGTLDRNNPLKKASFDPIFGSMNIQSIDAKETRRAVMLAAWQYRKTMGLTMSEALKRAWSDYKIVKARAGKPNVIFFKDYINTREVVQYGKAENY